MTRHSAMSVCASCECSPSMSIMTISRRHVYPTKHIVRRSLARQSFARTERCTEQQTTPYRAARGQEATPCATTADTRQGRKLLKERRHAVLIPLALVGGDSSGQCRPIHRGDVGLDFRDGGGPHCFARAVGRESLLASLRSLEAGGGARTHVVEGDRRLDKGKGNGAMARPSLRKNRA